MDISVGYYDPVWVLIIPSSNNAYVSVTGTQSSSSSYDSYSDNSTYLVAILVPTIVGGTLLIIVMVVIIVCCINCKVRKDLNQASAAVANPFERPSRPQIYYPSQRNYSEGNVNQGAVAMGTPQPAVQLKQNKKQKIYIIEPVPTKPVEPKSYDPADPVLETSIHVGEGEPVSQKQ